MEPKIEIKSTFNIIANKLKLEGVKRKWRSLVSESKLNELEKVLGAGGPYSVSTKRVKLDESPDGLNEEKEGKGNWAKCSKEPLREAAKAFGGKKKKQESKRAQQVAEACQKIEEIFEKNGKIVSELEKLNKEVAELRTVVDGFMKKNANPRRQFP